MDSGKIRDALYDLIPNFDDQYAKIRQRKHETSGATIIEVLYGAKKPDGTPKYPEKDDDDGHGHFMALEIDGIYQIVMWRHPDSEGGYQEYGDYKKKNEMTDIYDNGADRYHHPLKDLEDAILEKRGLLDQAEQLMKMQDYDAEAVDKLLKKFSEIFDMNTPVEHDLKIQHGKLAEKNLRPLREVQKRRLIEQAKEFQNSDDWKNTSTRMKELMEQWKNIGNAGSVDKSLWTEFKDAQQTFFDRQRKHYTQMEELRTQSKKQKQEIISEARSIAQYSEDWKNTHERLEEMRSRWKQAGAAGKVEDAKLWAEFNDIRDNFYARKKKAEKKKEQEFLAKRQAKEALVAHAQGYADSRDYSVAAAERMKSMSAEWKEIGFCGKDYDDQLWSSFNTAQNTYWNGKKLWGEEKHRQWVKDTKAAIGRRQEQIKKIQQNIDTLKERQYTTSNEEKLEEINEWIQRDENQIEELKEKIKRMEDQLKDSC